MVAKKYFYESDPNGRGRGRGWYYHIGHGMMARMEDTKISHHGLTGGWIGNKEDAIRKVPAFQKRYWKKNPTHDPYKGGFDWEAYKKTNQGSYDYGLFTSKSEANTWLKKPRS